MNKYMEIANDLAKENLKDNSGGPFGACIVKNGVIVGKGDNKVLENNDPTAHAEIEAIRDASSRLNTYDLSDCELYTTCYPCPMCLSAIIWANIKKAYVSGSVKDAEEIGFRDDYIYKFIEGGCADRSVLEIEQMDSKPAKMLYKEYAEMHKVIY